MANKENRPIVLADDSPEDRILIPRAIRKAGLASRLICFEDGEEAIKYFAGDGAYSDRKEYPLPSLVLLDIKMPKRDGFEVLHWIRSKLEERIPVVMLTSSSLPEDILRAEMLGADAYFVKPACLSELTEMIKTLQVGSFTGKMIVAQRTSRYS